MTGMRQEAPQPHTAFARSYVRRWTRSRVIRTRGHATEVVFDATSFLVIPSASCISFATRTSRSSRWLTVGGGPDTGGHGSETPSDRPLERSGMNHCATIARFSAGRSAPDR